MNARSGSIQLLDAGTESTFSVRASKVAHISFVASGDVIMSVTVNPTVSRFMPALRYRDLSAAIDWLCRAFGFEGHDVVTAVDGTILRARLRFGSELILLLPVRTSHPPVSKPAEEIGYEMQSYYFIVDDPDEHCLNAKEAGAEVIEITEYDDGGRGYSCRDPEGHIWNFVTYDSSPTQATPE